ncbi:TonB-dependent receptor [Flavobacterium silvisoli]|uniref:TonB-dependent receptor n=1 Tax=Flavobacterium silvisoli TaxID=2529433 RepID=UPI001F00AA3A|nr:TonB-dependent receptor [Flavobacterium silvisoli]
MVKPYTPTISDAFKVKETPTLEDEETSKKENIQYNIFSFPVASTFAPAKGKAANVDKSPQEKIFSNYLTLAAGNYGTVGAELFVTQNVSNTDYFGGMLRHNSSQGGIKDVVLDDKFSTTALDLTYGSRTKTMTWNADIGYKNQIYNWYGLHPDILDDATVESINEKQTYNTLYVGGRLGLNSILKESSVKFTRFWDAYGSAENRFVGKPSLEFDIVEQKIKADFVIDYLNGSFDQTYFGGASYKYGFTNLGFQPSIKIRKDDLTVNAGVGFFYSAAQEAGDSKFFIYPQVTGSYRVVGDLMVFYAGLEGTLQQNSYNDFVQENFFVSPTLGVAPTDQKYDVYAGLKGKLASSVSYNIRGSYKNEENKPLFKSNGYDHFNSNTEGYAYTNSFGVVYDNIKTVSFFGELKADFSKNVSFGINGTFSSFTTDVEEEAWNLPAIKIASNLDVAFTPKWSAGVNVFFVGERKDFFRQYSVITPIPDEPITLKSYFDLNANISYKHSERLTFFLKGNNLANQDYQRWLNYPVQGLQILGGASFKFDF